jgi:hypothetical protein
LLRGFKADQVGEEVVSFLKRVLEEKSEVPFNDHLY